MQSMASPMKKSPAKRSVSPGATSESPNEKKKRPETPPTIPGSGVVLTMPVLSAMTPSIVQEVEGADSTASSPLTVTEETKPSYVFKDPNFKHSSRSTATSKRTRVWKNLKQVMTVERALKWGPDEATFGTIGAPPSFKPPKKYSDLSGLPSNYTDPHTKLRYANSEEFTRIPFLPSDIVSGYLALRKASGIVS